MSLMMMTCLFIHLFMYLASSGGKGRSCLVLTSLCLSMRRVYMCCVSAKRVEGENGSHEVNARSKVFFSPLLQSCFSLFPDFPYKKGSRVNFVPCFPLRVLLIMMTEKERRC